MADPKAIADAYLATWNEDDGVRRRALLSQSWSADARYADPMMAGEGREGIATMIEAARAQFPGHAFALRGAPDGHKCFVRLSWLLAREGGAPVANGTDAVRLDDAGRIVEVIGFLDANGA